MPWRLPIWLLSPSDRAFRRWRLEHWIDTALSCGLRVVDISTQTAPQLRVEVRARPVTVHIEAPGSPKSGLRVIAVLDARPPGLPDVRICRLASVPPGTRDFESGDELFDEAFSVEGPARLLRGLLDAEMRRLLVGFQAESRLEISRGEIRLDTSDEELPDVLPLLLDLARRLTQKVHVAQRLAENARCDPEAGVRLRNLILLAETPGVPEVTDVLHAACSDASARVRLRAALELGERGRGVLFEVAESREDDACSAQAVLSLGRELPFERTQAILNGALRRRHIQTARACLEALGESGDPAAVDVLAKVMALEKGELAAAAARALGATGSPAAVLPLQEAAERSPDDQELQSATRQAIAAIKARLQGVSPGRLSLAAAETGQISLVPEAGLLSLTRAEPGQLSLPPEKKDQE